MNMFKPAAIFSDHMVLCHGKEVRIFGCAPDLCEVSASVLSSGGECIAKGSDLAKDGRFLLCLPPMKPQTGCTLTLSCGDETKTIQDVAIGEVLLAGGQSNMELEIQNADEGPALIPVHNDPDLRFFNVPKQPVWNEAAIAAEEHSRWQVVAPDGCRDVSAVAYFCAMKLREKKHIPVGVIDCYWGGTSASCWMDEEALLRTRAGQFYLSSYQAMYGHVTPEQFDQAQKEYDARLADYNQRVNALKAENPAITPTELNEKAGLYPWPPPAGCKSPYRPAGLCETMLRRVVPYTLSAALYYQGEEDASRPNYYESLLSSLIIRWREFFMDEDLPFVNVQLPMFIGKDCPDDKTWPIVRQAQHRVWRTLRNTGLAVIIDCGEFDNIHPTNKRTPGERVCDQLLSLLYQEDAPMLPRAIGKHTRGDVLTVKLSAPVHAVDGPADLLELAGQDGIFHPAACDVADCELHLTAPEVPHPVMARYAWVNYAKVHLFGQNGLPLAPFLLD